MPDKFSFFSFMTGQYMASEEGKCRGMVERETGKISAVITYGVNSSYEERNLHISNHVHSCPYTVEDRIILAARDAIR